MPSIIPQSCTWIPDIVAVKIYTKGIKAKTKLNGRRTPQPGFFISLLSDKKLTWKEINIMLRYAIIFLVVALLAAFLGFGGIAGAAAGVAKILFYIFVVFFLISLVANFLRRA